MGHHPAAGARGRQGVGDPSRAIAVVESAIDIGAARCADPHAAAAAAEAADSAGTAIPPHAAAAAASASAATYGPVSAARTGRLERDILKRDFRGRSDEHASAKPRAAARARGTAAAIAAERDGVRDRQIGDGDVPGIDEEAAELVVAGHEVVAAGRSVMPVDLERSPVADDQRQIGGERDVCGDLDRELAIGRRSGEVLQRLAQLRLVGDCDGRDRHFALPARRWPGGPRSTRREYHHLAVRTDRCFADESPKRCLKCL